MALGDYLQGSEAGQIVELYKMTIGNEFFYFTSFEKDFVFGGETFLAIPIENKGFSNDEKMKPTPLKLSLNLTEPAIRYIANTPAEVIKIEITHVLKSNVAEYAVFYIGRVMSVEIDEKGATFNLESRTDVFRQKIPNVLHSSLCNNLVFDDVCSLIEGNYTDSATLSDITDATLTSTAFGARPNGYFTRGKIRTSFGDVRMITNHVGNVITLQLPFDSRLKVGQVVQAVRGCDRKRTTCAAFGNLANYVGMPEIPSHNPAVWGVEKTKSFESSGGFKLF